MTYFAIYLHVIMIKTGYFQNKKPSKIFFLEGFVNFSLSNVEQLSYRFINLTEVEG